MVVVVGLISPVPDPGLNRAVVAGADEFVGDEEEGEGELSKQETRS